MRAMKCIAGFLLALMLLLTLTANVFAVRVNNDRYHNGYKSHG